MNASLSSESSSSRQADLAALLAPARSAALAIFIPGLLLLVALPASATDKLEKHFKVDSSGHALVTIHNPNGIVTVRAWTKSEVKVIATPASDHVDVDAEQHGNRVDLTTHQVTETVAPSDLRTDYEISVPEDTELQIHNDSGSVNVSNVLGDMNVETLASDVAVQDAAGYLYVQTSSGGFACLRCAGRLAVHSITGSFRLLDMRSYHVQAQTTKGNILFSGEFLPNGTYSLTNYSGQIEVRFGPLDSFDVSAVSLKGKVVNEAKLVPPTHPAMHFLPKFGNSLFGSFNAGRAKVELSSYDGTISILKRN